MTARRRRELERDRPARVAADDAEQLLLGEAVDLHDDAVDVVVELARGAPRARRSAAITESMPSCVPSAG